MSKEKEKPQEETDEIQPNDDDETWAKDHYGRPYYYDDAHGYREFDPDEDDDD